MADLRPDCNDIHSDCHSDCPPRAARRKRKIHDWLTYPDSVVLTEFQKFVLSVDWDNSPVGPIASWPPQLKQMVLLIMKDPEPAALFWGDGDTIIYNESYGLHLCGDKHPALQGQDPKIHFAEFWEPHTKILDGQREGGEPYIDINALLVINRYGFMEDMYVTWKSVPIIGQDGWMVGSHTTVTDRTTDVMTNRRMAAVRSLGTEMSKARSIKELWASIIRGLEYPVNDCPAAVLYSIKENTHLSHASFGVCELEGSIGIPAGHKFAMNEIDLDSQADEHVLAPYFRKAAIDGTPTVISLSKELQQDVADIEWRGCGLPSETFIVCHIKDLAFLVLALNPRLKYDDSFQDFIKSILQQITTPQIASIILHKEVERRASVAMQEAEARARLTRKLSDVEKKLAKFSSRAPIGLAVMSPEGIVITANELWQELVQLGPGADISAWPAVFVEEDLEPVQIAWAQLFSGREPITMPIRTNRQWIAPDVDEQGSPQYTPTHLMLTLYPDFDHEEEPVSIMSCVSDISHLKWSEDQLRQRMEMAVELKKQQDNFIDMTCHELRNPLSALIGCADEIISCLNESRSALRIKRNELTGGNRNKKTKYDGPLALIEEATDATNTIIYCALHQKRIIDDILTLSKLDSNLLEICPEVTKPIDLTRNAQRMFDAETKRADVDLVLVEQDSLKDLGIEYVLMDSGRFVQIYINFMTNAIKFTRTEKIRKIVITLSAHVEPPSKDKDSAVRFIKRSKTNVDQTNSTEWGDGEVIYISLTVEDTGRGLSQSELETIFNPFQQASPKTYVKYGGSGLGLFISRQLVEKQGGEIGVKSEAGKGTTFQFYIKARRIFPSPGTVEDDPLLQLMIREDSLQEACGAEMPAWNDSMQKEAALAVGTVSSGLIRDKCFHILVVEDNLVNQKVLCKQLQREGHVVHVANHGGEALEFIRRSTFWRSTKDQYFRHQLNVILLDLEMPVMDGLTCMKKIREFQKAGEIVKHIPVIAVTANARIDQISTCHEAGVDEVTTKPYRIKDIMKQIHMVVEKYPAVDDFHL